MDFSQILNANKHIKPQQMWSVKTQIKMAKKNTL